MSHHDHDIRDEDMRHEDMRHEDMRHEDMRHEDMRHEIDSELARLIESLLDGTISEAGSQRLEAALLSNESARSYYLERAILHTLLESESATLDGDAKRQETPLQPGGGPFAGSLAVPQCRTDCQTDA